MEYPKKIIFAPLEGKTITWFSNTNEYVVLENETASILKRIHKEESIDSIAKSLNIDFSIPYEKAVDFILDLENRFLKQQKGATEDTTSDYRHLKKPKDYQYTLYYKINEVVFKMRYLSEVELDFVHPKFSHLVTNDTSSFDHTFEVFVRHNFIFLYVNSDFVGGWNSKEIHYFQGKFSMELIQKIHQKEEKEWLGVFHASAVSDGKKSVLFLGDSGNGKSTSLALLQAHGFTCLADDFVPMDVENQEIYSFPAAISIKKSSLDTLLPLYPELDNTSEYHFPRLNKTVRYLAPNNTNFFDHQPCHELVFIKYEENAALNFEKISTLEAFQQFVPDSWLSPIKENAEIFLDWFTRLHCYQLTYSKNQEMIATVSKIYSNEL